jgi:hypothetical protein
MKPEHCAPAIPPGIDLPEPDAIKQITAAKPEREHSNRKRSLARQLERNGPEKEEQRP